MYERLEITGLRGFAETEILNLAQPNGQMGGGLTILVGPNNGGKSTVIEAFRSLAHKKDISFTEGKRNKMAGDKVLLELISNNGRHFLKTVASGGSETDRDNLNFSDGQILALPSRRYFNTYFGKNFSERQQYVQQIGSLTGRGQVVPFEGRLFKIQTEREKFNEVLGDVLNPVPDWTIEQADQGSYYLKFQSGDQYHTSDGMGEGIVSLFFIIDTLYDSVRGSAIVLDEPELSLHPMLQKRLAKLLAEYSKDRQIVFATHSPYFIDFDYVINGARVARVVKLESRSKIFELKSTTVDTLKGFRGDRGNPHVLGLDAREAFFLEDGIMLVEGQEDVLLYPKILQQLGMNIRAEFFGWGVGGAEKMRFIAKLFRDLGFSKLIGILDGDKSSLVEQLQKEFPNYLFLSIPADDVRTKPPISEKAGVTGLLDEDKLLRNEHKDALISLFYQANNYLGGISTR